ncbi:DEAD/DEAH box helicase family protein [Streptomyces klenkii]|uniref:DEAD/DEAH box helicase family protein n=1 Tax=Streptomyces klenkii TaxID=1420899 RepID=UPI0036ECEF19
MIPSSHEQRGCRKNNPSTPTRRSDQQIATDSAARQLKNPGSRGHLISACGAGKTLIALRTAETPDVSCLLIAVPPLDLIAQWAATARSDGRREPGHDGFPKNVRSSGFVGTAAPWRLCFEASLVILL